MPDFWQKLACFWQINAISGQNWQKSYLIAVRFMNLIARILLETAQNLASFWHKTGVPLSIWKFQIKKKIYILHKPVILLFLFSCQFCASFLQVSCQLYVAAGNWTLDLVYQFWSAVLSRLVHRPINIIIKEFCKKCYLNLYYLFILRFQPETNKFFLKNILIVHKQKLTQKCQNSSKNLNFLMYNFRLYGWKFN